MSGTGFGIGDDLVNGFSKEETRRRAEANFKRKEAKAHADSKAVAEYAAASRALIERTARLKALRLAKEAAEAKARVETAPTTSAKKRYCTSTTNNPLKKTNDPQCSSPTRAPSANQVGLAGTMYVGQAPTAQTWQYALATLAGAMIGATVGLRWLSQTITRYTLAVILVAAGIQLVAF